MQKILLVEDNEMNRDLISRRLTRRGYEVILAKDGAEGVERAQKDAPDLILMDIGLPILDGYEATRLIKESNADVPIIGLSAHAMSGDADRARDAGADDYDTKPVDFPRLLGKIQTLLERAASQSADTGEAVIAEAPVAEGHADVRLLVVDDSSMHREMLSGRLATLGYSFDMTADISEAIEHLRRGGYGAILLDVTLPDVGGAPVLRYLRSQAEVGKLPILLLSTIDAVPKAVEFLGDGADEVIAQPFRSQELRVRLDTILGRGRNRGDGGDGGGSTEHLMRAMLPDPLIDELRQTHRLPPRRTDAVSVLAWDTPEIDAPMLEDPLATAQRLQRLLVAYEAIAANNKVHTLRTAGDGVLAVAASFTGADDPVTSLVRTAAELRRVAAELVPDWLVRIGIHTGPAAVAFVGHRTCQLGIWGQPVRIARRLRNLCRTTTVLASAEVWERCAGRAEGIQAGTAELKEGPPAPVYRIDKIG